MPPPEEGDELEEVEEVELEEVQADELVDRASVLVGEGASELDSLEEDEVASEVVASVELEVCSLEEVVGVG